MFHVKQFGRPDGSPDARDGQPIVLRRGPILQIGREDYSFEVAMATPKKDDPGQWFMPVVMLVIITIMAFGLLSCAPLGLVKACMQRSIGCS